LSRPSFSIRTILAVPQRRHAVAAAASPLVDFLGADLLFDEVKKYCAMHRAQDSFIRVPAVTRHDDPLLQRIL
jgi:hypothetical protein